MNRRPILVEGIYGLSTKDSKKGPFGFKTGQNRRNPIERTAGWFNRHGERLGWGDLDERDLTRISKEIPDDELFVVLTQYNAWRLDTLEGPLGIIEEGMPFTEPEYVASRCRFVIEKGHIHPVYEEDPHTAEGISRDKAYLMITGHPRSGSLRRFPQIPYPRTELPLGRFENRPLFIDKPKGGKTESALDMFNLLFASSEREVMKPYVDEKSTNRIVVSTLEASQVESALVEFGFQKGSREQFRDVTWGTWDDQLEGSWWDDEIRYRLGDTNLCLRIIPGPGLAAEYLSREKAIKWGWLSPDGFAIAASVDPAAFIPESEMRTTIYIVRLSEGEEADPADLGRRLVDKLRTMDRAVFYNRITFERYV